MAHVGAPHHGPAEAEVIFEHRRLGAWLRVAAIDPATGLEAVATGPAESPAQLERLAAAKLARLLAAQSASAKA